MAGTRLTRMLASVSDRDRAIRIIKESFIEGRLAMDEFEQRVGQVMESREFGELLALTADLPVRSPFDRLPSHPTAPRRSGPLPLRLPCGSDPRWHGYSAARQAFT